MSESNGTREGYHSITPRIVVDDLAAQVHFLRLVFEARGEVEPNRPAEMRIGDSLLMVTSATERERFPAFLYVYVRQADEVYQRAIAAGATSLEAPIDTPYGDRRGMVRDPFGNIFQIAHRIAAAF
jgi:PhnB protein